jgi:hypothetical protein
LFATNVHSGSVDFIVAFSLEMVEDALVIVEGCDSSAGILIWAASIWSASIFQTPRLTVRCSCIHTQMSWYPG